MKDETWRRRINKEDVTWRKRINKVGEEAFNATGDKKRRGRPRKR